MKIFKIALLILIIPCVLSFAQDKALLNTLVQKGIISEEEALYVEKQNVYITSDNPDLRKFVLSGRLQTQFYWSEAGSDAPAEVPNQSDYGFQIRRIILKLEAKLSENWRAVVSTDFARVNTNGAKYLLDNYIAKKISYEYLNGELVFGYKKVNFGCEENMSSGALATIERSVSNRYFVGMQSDSGRLGFGTRYVGIYWDAKIQQVEGLGYSLAVTNSVNESILPQERLGGVSSGARTDSTPNLWASVSYTRNFDDDIKVKFGLNFGYGNGANAVSDDKHGYIIGAEPYIMGNIGNFKFWADYLVADVQYGKNFNSSNAVPQGFNVCGEYVFDIESWGKLGVAVRYSGLFTDGRGMGMSDVYPKVTNVSAAPDKCYDSSQSIYAGLNWYISGNDDVKLQIGYERAELYGSPSGEVVYGNKSAYADIVRVQMQINF